MTTQHNIDYKNNLFEHPELTRIVGELTTATLITLQAEIHDNAQAVQAVLGGGAHGHLRLVCTPASFRTLLPGVEPYVRPVNPGALKLAPEPLMQSQIAQAGGEHRKCTRLFCEVLSADSELH